MIIWYPFRIDSVDKYYCKSDSDCVPETCCHPDSCIHKNFGPNCEGVICSQECAPGTLDCSQGVCRCIDNKCQPIMGSEE